MTDWELQIVTAGNLRPYVGMQINLLTIIADSFQKIVHFMYMYIFDKNLRGCGSNGHNTLSGVPDRQKLNYGISYLANFWLFFALQEY